MLELAQLYLNLDEVDACQQQCSAILKRDKFNEEATLVWLFFFRVWPLQSFQQIIYGPFKCEFCP